MVMWNARAQICAIAANAKQTKQMICSLENVLVLNVEQQVYVHIAAMRCLSLQSGCEMTKVFKHYRVLLVKSTE